VNDQFHFYLWVIIPVRKIQYVGCGTLHGECFMPSFTRVHPRRTVIAVFNFSKTRTSEVVAVASVNGKMTPNTYTNGMDCEIFGMVCGPERRHQGELQLISAQVLPSYGLSPLVELRYNCVRLVQQVQASLVLVGTAGSHACTAGPRGGGRRSVLRSDPTRTQTQALLPFGVSPAEELEGSGGSCKAVRSGSYRTRLSILSPGRPDRHDVCIRRRDRRFYLP